MLTFLSTAAFIWKERISFVSDVHPRIVFKVPKSGQFEEEQLRKEVKIIRSFRNIRSVQVTAFSSSTCEVRPLLEFDRCLY